ncbi:hypothetical protein GCM10023189_40690 [Nibrella saemangeumensis]|uniref:HTH luxR-type domain-containing protein n=2 Tax=Nibrella saemangeumensis TaxID=1084526 RepID=A0ABP8NCM4_9BACT
MSFLQGLTDDELNQITTSPIDSHESLFSELLAKYASQVIYILDYTNKEYTTFTENCLNLSGHPSAAFLEGGLEFTLSRWHPNDLFYFNQHIFSENFKLFMSVPPNELSSYRVSYNYRFKRPNGQWTDCLQQSTIINAAPTGLPLATFGTVSDITAFNADGRISHRIERLLENGIWETFYCKNYFPNVDEDKLLSKAEIEVLKWIIEGYSSQAIADKLHRSLHTVKTHRKHMLEKTNAKNTAELLRFAIKNGLV